MIKKTPKTEAEWKKKLTSEQFEILRKGATEPAFGGKWLRNKEKGVYSCAGCGLELFDSTYKYDSGSGWPSFWDISEDGHIELLEDDSQGMRRIEVRCSNCKSHLGHVFDDGPIDKTGLRYCINSAALEFVKKEDK